MDEIDVLIAQYKPMVRKIARGYFLPGADIEDLIQEGMIGLYKAIRTFRKEEGVPFEYYAKLCTERQIKSAVRSSLREHHKVLNESVSFDPLIQAEDENEGTILQYLEDMSNGNPEDVLVEREEEDRLFQELEKQLSPLEQQVLNQVRSGKDYLEAAKTLGISPKSADNALQRVRRKAKQILKEYP